MLHRTMSLSLSVSIAESAFSLWWKTVETLVASTEVVATRGRIIDRAMRDPMNADAAELGQMVGEKFYAFSRATLDASATGWALYSDIWGQAWDMSLPGSDSRCRMARRSRRITRNALSAGHRAIGPVHKTVTANKRRLSGG